LPWKRKKRHGTKQVITLDADGRNASIAVTAERWARGGHHPNWCPDGEHVLMNLNTRGDGLRFARLTRDGSECDTLVPEIRGSGHPSLHRDGRYLLTDAYVTEPVAFGDGTAPIRFIDLHAATDTTLARIRTRPAAEKRTGALRVDPHPAWDRGFTRIAFNACPGGSRQVFVADLREVLQAG
jgi:Tol biopolymer transport system component